MSGRAKFTPSEQMTVEEFLAFTETRPNEETWQLIEGVPVMNASPVDYHQIVVANLVTWLMNHKRAVNAAGLPIPGIGTRVPLSSRSLPQPNILVLEGRPTGLSVTGDALVIFEILSRSNTKADREWRRRIYASVPNCQHYVTVSLRKAETVVFDRSTGWNERKTEGHQALLRLQALDADIPLAEVYRYTPVL